MSKIIRFQVRRGPAAEWTTDNPILLSGEIGYETDDNKFKIGDGVTPWNSLAYTAGPQGPQGIQGPVGPPGPAEGFPMFIQGATPSTSASKYLWWDTSQATPTLWIQDGT